MELCYVFMIIESVFQDPCLESISNLKDVLVMFMAGVFLELSYVFGCPSVEVCGGLSYG